MKPTDFFKRFLSVGFIYLLGEDHFDFFYLPNE